MNTVRNQRWDRLDCPKCGAKRSLSKYQYAQLPNSCVIYDNSPRLDFLAYVNQPELGCGFCSWEGSKKELREFWTEFPDGNPQTNAPWYLKKLESKMWVRYKTTLALTDFYSWGGTADYSKGIDYHTEVHCESCCCKPSTQFGCKNPAAGRFTVSSYPNNVNWRNWCQVSATFHLSDGRRHPRVNVRMGTRKRTSALFIKPKKAISSMNDSEIDHLAKSAYERFLSVADVILLKQALSKESE
jgi:hypothetical protein